MPANDEHAVVYGSDLIVRDPAELTALCLFYDRVYLPILAFPAFYKQREANAMILVQPTTEWDEQTAPLFSKGIIKRLGDVKIRGSDILSFQENFTSAIQKFEKERGPSQWFDYSTWDLAWHWARKDVHLPQLHSLKSDSLPREALKLALAESTFSFLLPATNALEPDNILAVREEVMDNREGFSMHLQKLSANVEGRINAGDSHEDIAKYAQSVVETELIPDYREFMRQLQAHDKAKTANKVLAPLVKVLEIESPVTSIKFWAELAKILGFDVLKGVADDESYTNKNQAIQFMRKVDRRD